MKLTRSQMEAIAFKVQVAVMESNRKYNEKLLTETTKVWEKTPVGKAYLNLKKVCPKAHVSGIDQPSLYYLKGRKVDPQIHTIVNDITLKTIGEKDFNPEAFIKELTKLYI